MRNLVSVAAAAAAILAVALPAGAAPGPGPNLTSSPAGLSVKLSGPVKISGSTPISLADVPAGRYRLRVGAAGTGHAMGRLTRGVDGTLHLGRLVGPEAVLLPPGVTFFRQGAETRGLLFAAGGVAGATGTVWKAVRLHDAQRDADLARERYNAAVSPTAIDQARLDILAANDRVADEKNLRNMWGAYLGAVWAGAALESWILTPSPGLRDGGHGNYTLVGPGGGRFGATVRSILVPGAGQRYLGHPQRGNRFTTAAMLLGAGSIVAQQSFLAARRRQNDAQRRYDAAETETETSVWRSRLQDDGDRTRSRNRLRWGLVGATVGVYLWNVIDAGTLGPGNSEPRALSWGVSPDEGGFRAELVWRMS